MSALRIAGLAAAVILLSHPTIALADDCGDTPCMCIDDCNVPPPPTPNLPPPVAIFGGGQTAGRSDAYHDGVHQAQVGAYLYDYVTQAGRIGDAPLSSGSNTGTYSANVAIYPDASVDVGSINGVIGANLLYSVVLHAPNAAAAVYIRSLLGISGAIAQVHGVSSLSAFANGLGGYADDYVTTGAGIFGDQEAYVPVGLYGNVSGNSGLFSRVGFDCDYRNYGYQHNGTAGCGTHDFTLPVNFVSATNYVGGDALDFIGSIELSAGSTSIQSGAADSYLDPTVSFSPGFNSQGVGLTVGGGMVGNGAVPEPASWALMMVGFASLGAVLRRGRSTVVAA